MSKSEYDTANRPMRITHMSGNNHLYTGEVQYDEYNNLKQFKEQVGTGRTAYQTDFTYDKENKPTLMTFGDTNNKVAYGYDALGRMSTRTVTVGGVASASTYSYVPGGHGTGSTTALISSISQGNDESCAYTYDDVGNITAATRGNVTTTYAYDNLGQLIRVNDPSDTASGSTGTTWVYEYDRGGNILNKKRYAYTTGTVGTLLQTISYGYDTTWKDKLTSYNGQSITYDQIGNPLNDGTWNYQWEQGRRLWQIYKGEDDQPGSAFIDFMYNADGLRTVKQNLYYDANGVMHSVNTEYTLHGKNIVHMVQESNALHFWYDAQNRPAIVDFNGTKYAYILNLQGDVVGIKNASGTEVVRYTYDAWGKLLETTGELASSLGYLNPFRYRGYVYDEETGLYYLRSRYYNPEWNRFVNADVLIKGNLYSYCCNNSIIRVDSNGANWDQVGFDAEANDAYFNNFVKPQIMGFMRIALDYRYPGKNPKYSEIDKDAGYIEATYYTSGKNKGKLRTQGVVDCSHFLHETTGVGNTNSPKRYDEVSNEFKGELYDENHCLQVTLYQGMEVYSADKGHCGILILFDLGNGEEWCVAQSTSEIIKNARAYFENDKFRGPNITSLTALEGEETNWVYYTKPRY